MYIPTYDEIERQEKRRRYAEKKQEVKQSKRKHHIGKKQKLLISLAGDHISYDRNTGRPVYTKINKKYIAYHERITRKGKEFSISLPFFKKLLNMPCAYCGTRENITIDRIDSNVGYTSDNCQPCCQKCNSMKWDLDHERFISHIKKILEHINNNVKSEKNSYVL